uniref:Uncharacterized protein n=1 Tax=Candidatus Kentrum sp. LFY TaxID=2126342 RepID=A0A450WUW6_9GAMM|nr:MAG: hypothetical protein BECKLFY1418C_GA0070996_10808 [Candidatus Kentron sp. LFY]
MDIPISAAKEIAEKYDYDQVIIVVDKHHCDIAARFVNFLKYTVMGWHDENAALEPGTPGKR